MWWAAELRFLRYGPDRAVRAMVATTDRRRLPAASTWYLSTNLPLAEAPLAEVVRLYGLRNWIEQHYKRIKNELGWADFMVRSDTAIRRHWALVCCAFAYCWWHEFRQQAAAAPTAALATAPPVQQTTRSVADAPPRAARGKNRAPPLPCWPRALRRVRAWLAPLKWIAECWRGWASGPAPPGLAALLDAMGRGHGLHHYLRE